LNPGAIHAALKLFKNWGLWILELILELILEENKKPVKNPGTYRYTKVKAGVMHGI